LLFVAVVGVTVMKALQETHVTSTLTWARRRRVSPLTSVQPRSAGAPALRPARARQPLRGSLAALGCSHLLVLRPAAPARTRGRLRRRRL